MPATNHSGAHNIRERKTVEVVVVVVVVEVISVEIIG